MSYSDIGTALTERLLWASLLFGVAVIAVLALTKLSALPAKFRYWCWRLTLVSPMVVLTTDIGLHIQSGVGIKESVSAQSTFGPILFGLVTFWAVVAAARLVEQAAVHVRTARMIRSLKARPCPGWAGGHRVACRESETNDLFVALTPRPTIVAPSWCWEDTQDSRIAIAHEVEHLRSKDLIWQMTASVFNCIFWFHPLAKVAERELQLWHECAADEGAIRAVGCSRRDYVDAVIRIGMSPQPDTAASLGLGMKARQIKRRLEVGLTETTRFRWLHSIIACALLVPAIVPWRLTPADQPETRDRTNGLGSVSESVRSVSGAQPMRRLMQ